MSNHNFVFLILATVFFFISCSKSGSTGPAGTSGPAGAAGNPGIQGPPGVANVIYSDWKYAASFNDSAMDGSNVKVAYIDAPEIVDSILTKGSVKVYFTFSAGTYVLPYTSNAGGKANTMSYMPLLGEVLITRFTHDNSNSVSFSTGLQYRYVIIPGGVSAFGMVNWKDYNSVAEYYHFIN